MDELQEKLRGISPNLVEMVSGRISQLAKTHHMDRRTATSYLLGQWGSHKTSHPRALALVLDALKILKNHNAIADELQALAEEAETVA